MGGAGLLALLDVRLRGVSGHSEVVEKEKARRAHALQGVPEEWRLFAVEP